MKKVAHITFDMKIGGAEQVILNLVDHTDKTKYDVSLVCLQQPLGPFGVRLSRNGCRVTCFDRKPGLDVNLIRQLRDHVIRNRIDILHCHQYSPFAYGLLSSIGTGAKVIFTEHGRFYPDRRKLKRVIVNPVLSLLTDHITAISEATRDALVQIENIPGNRIDVIYNGLDDAPYLADVDRNGLKESLGIGPEAHVLGTVARLDTIKNHRMMIRALSRVRQTCPDTFLIIVGDGPERHNTESWAREYNVADRVILTGFRQDVYRFLRIMDIFLLTSFSEGTAMTLLEAMASGVPCIATDVGGNPEIVSDGTTGFIVPSDDDQALGQKILTLFTATKLMKAMGNAGRRRFEERFTVGKMLQAYQALYG